MKKGEKDWDYQFVSDCEIVNVFIPKNTHLSGHEELKQKLLLLQQVECDNHLTSSIVNLYNTSSIEWIEHVRKMGHKYVAFWFDGCWPKSDGIEKKILTYINRLEKKDWVTAVHPKYLDSLMLLNIDEFIAWPAKAPNFGTYAFWAENWISDCTVELSKTIERNIVVGAPQSDPQNFLNGLMDKKYTDHTISRGARVIIKRKNIPSSPIYFVNTERSSPTVADAIKHTVFKQYVGAVAGFKLLYYAYTYGIDIDSTKFVWYDFDANSVQFKRDTIKNWDGNDYPTWVKEWVHAHPEANAELLKHVDKEWLNIVKQFGGKQQWLDFWVQVQMCEHEFLTVDLVNNHKEITDRLVNGASTFFWSSNIYSYVLLKVISKPFTLERSFAELITRLQQIETCWFSGTDPNDNDLTCDVKWILGYSTNDSIGTGI
jgi:hypothetical protein